ncbi:3-ketoacyl-CoA synthase 9 [Raphanus sativus]|nr:3-ketoacyl-CoA synthase 9 [Raphanus sativus]
MKTPQKLPNVVQSVNTKYVKLGYHYLITHLFKLCLVPLTAVAISEISRLTPHDFHQLWLHLQHNLVSFTLLSALAVSVSTVFIMTRPRPVYLVDYSCYLPPESLQVPYKKFMDHSTLIEDFNESSLEFQRKILERSGLGEETYLPEGLHCVSRSCSAASTDSSRTPKLTLGI